MAETNKPIFATSLVDIEGLGKFWGKAKEYVDGKIGSFSSATGADDATGICKVIEDNEKITAAALTDLDGRVSENSDAISSIQDELESLSGGAGSIATQINNAINNLNLPTTYLKISDEKVKTVDTTAKSGVALTHDANGKLGINVTAGSVSENNSSVVTGGAVYTAVESAKSASAVTMSESAGTGSVLKTYTFTQNGKTIGTIDLAKDLVVTKGEVKMCTLDGVDVKCIELTISSGDIVHIPVSDLVDVYTEGDYISIDDNNKISVDKDGIISGLAKVGDSYTKTESDDKYVTKEGYVAYSETEKSKLSGIASGAQVNVIENIKVNGVLGTITDKVANVTVDCYTKNEVDSKDTEVLNAAKAYTNELGKIVKGVYEDNQLKTAGHEQRIEALENISIATEDQILAIFA